METNTQEVITQELDAALPPLLEQCRALVVETAPQAQFAADLLTSELVPRRQAITEYFAPLKTAAHKAHRLICEREKLALARLEEPERIVRDKLAQFAAAEQARRREAEARQRAELAAAQEAARAAAFDRAVERGDTAAAERLLDDSAPPPLVVVPGEPVPEVAKLDGIGFVERRTVVVEDFAALVAAVAAGTVPITVLSVNQSALNKLAVALGATFAAPGCRVVVETAVRRVGTRGE